MIQFHLPIIPPKATSQSAGKRMAVVGGRPMFFKNKKAAEAEHDLLALCAPYRPAKPFEGPIRLSVALTWPWRASEPKKRKILGRARHTTKPDADNAAKILIDCLGKLRFFEDDAQIADLEIAKWWGDDVGIWVILGEIEE